MAIKINTQIGIQHTQLHTTFPLFHKPQFVPQAEKKKPVFYVYLYLCSQHNLKNIWIAQFICNKSYIAFLNNWGEIFSCSEHIKSGLLDGIAYQSMSPCQKNISRCVAAISMQLSSWLHVSMLQATKKRNQWGKTDCWTAKKCWYMSCWYVINIPLHCLDW